jgi:carnitine O-acetyltransferase
MLTDRRLPYSQTLPVEMLKGGKPQCMHQYSRVLGVTRIPMPQCDTFSQVNEHANHVIIIVRDQIYPLDVYHVVEGKRERVNVEELERLVRFRLLHGIASNTESNFG